MNVSFTRKSQNRKTGPIPVSMQDKSTCPTDCPFYDRGCYAKYGMLGMLWQRLMKGLIGVTWALFIIRLRTLPQEGIWRYGQAGDLPGKGNRIDRRKLNELIEANNRRKVIAYTHKPMTRVNREMIEDANKRGFTVNLSADHLKEADKLADLGIAPVVVTMPWDQKHWPKETPKGRRILPCVATTHPGVTCLKCRLCAVKDRSYLIGFAAHGTGKRYVETIFYMNGKS